MEKRNRITPRQIAILIGIAALVLILCFVYGNSMLSKQESAEVSSSVMDAMEGILRPIVEFVTGGPVDDTLLHKVVRKGAHFAEFAALSALLRYSCISFSAPGERTPWDTFSFSPCCLAFWMNFCNPLRGAGHRYGT
jgi:hypothetical protein